MNEKSTKFIIISMLIHGTFSDNSCTIAGHQTNAHDEDPNFKSERVIEMVFESVGDKYCTKGFNLSLEDIDIVPELTGHIVFYSPTVRTTNQIMCPDDVIFKATKLGEEIAISSYAVTITETKDVTGLYRCFPNFMHARVVNTIVVSLEKTLMLKTIISYRTEALISYQDKNSSRSVLIGPKTQMISAKTMALNLTPSKNLRAEVYIRENGLFGFTKNLLDQSYTTCDWFTKVDHHWVIGEVQLSCIRLGMLRSSLLPDLDNYTKYDIVDSLTQKVRLTSEGESAHISHISNYSICLCNYTQEGNKVRVDVKGYKTSYSVGSVNYHTSPIFVLSTPEFVLCNRVLVKCSGNVSTLETQTKWKFMHSEISPNDIPTFLSTHLTLSITAVLIVILLLKK
ncbi:hypothetical protein [Maize yellow stripe virus]|nr:hypothetical protein [Maize yellow stripe virus]